MNKLNTDEEVGRRVFQQFMDMFVSPEVARRQEIGELEKPVNLRAAQILFFPDERRPQVRINSEVRAIVNVKLKPEISKQPGEPIMEHELDGLNKINLTEEDDLDCGHATLLRIGERWAIAFDFRYSKNLAKQHIETSRQFCDTAESCIALENWAPFIDNLFSAAELVARSTLLLMPDPKFRRKTTHKAIQLRYNRFADLGNIDVEYRNTFNKLSGMRQQARYLKGDVSIDRDEAIRLLGVVRDMLENADSRAGV